MFLGKSPIERGSIFYIYFVYSHISIQILNNNNITIKYSVAKQDSSRMDRRASCVLETTSRQKLVTPRTVKLILLVMELVGYPMNNTLNVVCNRLIYRGTQKKISRKKETIETISSVLLSL